MFGQLSGQEETDGCLDLSGGDGGPLVVVGQTAGLGGDALEDVVHEGVHDGQGLGGDPCVGMHLLQHFVDVDGVRFPPPPFALLVSGTLGLGLAGGLLGSLGCWFGRHVHAVVVRRRMVCKAENALFISGTVCASASKQPLQQMTSRGHDQELFGEP